MHNAIAINNQVVNRYQAPVHGPKALVYKKLCAATLVFAFLVFQLWVRVSVIDAGYQLEEGRRDALMRDALLREVKLAHAFKTRPTLLREKIIRETGMVRLDPYRVRQVEVTN